MDVPGGGVEGPGTGTRKSAKPSFTGPVPGFVGHGILFQGRGMFLSIGRLFLAEDVGGRPSRAGRPILRWEIFGAAQ